MRFEINGASGSKARAKRSESVPVDTPQITRLLWSASASAIRGRRLDFESRRMDQCVVSKIRRHASIVSHTNNNRSNYVVLEGRQDALLMLIRSIRLTMYRLLFFLGIALKGLCRVRAFVPAARNTARMVISTLCPQHLRGPCRRLRQPTRQASVPTTCHEAHAPLLGVPESSRRDFTLT